MLAGHSLECDRCDTLLRGILSRGFPAGTVCSWRGQFPRQLAYDGVTEQIGVLDRLDIGSVVARRFGFEKIRGRQPLGGIVKSRAVLRSSARARSTRPAWARKTSACRWSMYCPSARRARVGQFQVAGARRLELVIVRQDEIVRDAISPGREPIVKVMDRNRGKLRLEDVKKSIRLKFPGF
jgi:hypothetical protein